MAIGDTVSDLVSKINIGVLAIQPGAGAEWIIQVFKSEQGKAIEIYHVDDAVGTNKKLIDTYQGGSVPVFHRVTSAKWIELKNISGVTQFVGYEGVITK